MKIILKSSMHKITALIVVLLTFFVITSTPTYAYNITTSTTISTYERVKIGQTGTFETFRLRFRYFDNTEAYTEANIYSVAPIVQYFNTDFMFINQSPLNIELYENNTYTITYYGVSIIIFRQNQFEFLASDGSILYANEYIDVLQDTYFQYTYNFTWSTEYQNGYNAGETSGYTKGYDKGSSDGYNTGYDAGETAGLTQGFINGRNAYAILLSGQYVDAMTYGQQQYDLGYYEGMQEYGAYHDGLYLGYNFPAGYYDADFMEELAKDFWTEYGMNAGRQEANNANLTLLTFIPSIIGSLGSFFLTLASFEFLGVSVLGVLIIMASLGAVLLVLKFIRG